MARTNNKAVEANAIGAYVTALFDAMVATARADDLAYEMVKGCSTVEATNTVRDGFKLAYSAKRKETDGDAFDADKCKAAADMAWSRVCAKAKDRGWVKPMAESAGAKKAKASRDAKKDGKVDGRTLRTGSRNAGSSKKVDVIVPDAGNDEELQAALDWVMDDESRQTMFVAWVEAQQKTTRTIRRAA